MHTASVDLSISTGTPPAPTLLAPPDGATVQAEEQQTVSWAPLPVVGGYSLQLAHTPTFGTPIIDAPGLLSSSYTLDSPLEPATCYFWRARAENGCGSGSWADPFHFATQAYQALFADDVESGGTQWLHQAAVGLDQWQISSMRSLSPTQAWYTPAAGSVTDTYLWNATPVLIQDDSVLSFWHVHYFEGSFDGSVLELSTDGGETWQDLATHILTNGYNGTINSGYGNPLEGRPAWVGDQPTWTQVQVDLSHFAGQSVLIRWRVGCDLGIGDEGWYLDNIQISAPLPPSVPPALSGILPSAGSPDIRTTVTITGTSFRPVVIVMVGDTMLSKISYIDATTLSAVVPAGLPPGNYDLTVINGDCQSATLDSAYTVDPSIQGYLLYLPQILR
jgi:hypothetical protein